MRDGMQGAERMAIMLIRGRLIRVCTTKGTIRGGGTKRPQWPTKQLRRVGLNALWRCGSGSIRSEPEQPKLARTIIRAERQVLPKRYSPLVEIKVSAADVKSTEIGSDLLWCLGRHEN
jgi:hypothetical protein